jgi:stress-induced morphogen
MGRWEVINVKKIDKSEKHDVGVQQLNTILAEYQHKHKKAEIDVRRRHEVSIHIRIIDPDFRGLDWIDREPEVWKLLKLLPDEIYADITVLLLLTPEEAPTSLANMEFENPLPSPI